MTYYLLEHGDHMQYGSVRRNGGWLSGVVGVHTTESITDMEGADPNAENTAAFIARRWQTQQDYGSYHIIADYDSIVDMMPAAYEAWADTTNNPHALSVSGALQAARWRELTQERANRIVANMAKAAAIKCRQAVNAGLLKSMPPARRITAREAIAGSKAGFYGHGETNPGTRYDPGAHFDWALFLSEYAKAADTTIATASSITPKPIPTDWFDMATEAQLKKIVEDAIANLPGQVWGYKNDGVEGKRDAYAILRDLPRRVWAYKNDNVTKSQAYSHLVYGTARLERIIAQNAALEAAVSALAEAKGVDPAAVEQAVSGAVERALSDVSITLTNATVEEEN